MSVDERAIGSLIEQSNDLHSDSMHTTRASLRDLVEEHREDATDRPERHVSGSERASLLRHGIGGGKALAALGAGGALLALMARPAFADQSADVQMLQTATSIEILAIATYEAALGLPFAGSLPKVVQTFATTTKQQHTDHQQAFSAAVRALGGTPQTKPDPVLLDVVNKAKPGLTGPVPLVELAITLEMGAAETYVAFVTTLTDKSARNTTASIMGVEAQHVAVLNAVKALVGAGHPEYITLPPPAAKLPAAAGSVGFPDAFYPYDMARPAAEGAVK
jgi:LmbE family N-acetylglucosaminyl deacetylase